MPIFVLRCINENCGALHEAITTHERASQMVCGECASPMEFAPTSCGFKVEGFSAANGYHRPEFSGVTGQDMPW